VFTDAWKRSFTEPADEKPGVVGGYSVIALLITVILVVGVLMAMAIALRNTESRHKAEVIRAVAELFRWKR
jgi:hypothetical protein